MGDEKTKTGPAILAALERIEKEQQRQATELKEVKAYIDAKKAIDNDDDDDY